MTFVGEILFTLLVIINVVTVVKLGWPWTYRDRGVSWYLWLTAWSYILFDGGFLLAITLKAHSVIIQVALLLALGLRVVVSGWLLKMVDESKEPGDGVDEAAPQRGSDPGDSGGHSGRPGWPGRFSGD